MPAGKNRIHVQGESMSRANEIYPYKKHIQRTLAQIRKDPHNAEDLLRFYEERLSEGISPARIYKCMSTLKLISIRLGCSFQRATKSDMVRLVSGIEQEEKFSAWTKRDYKVILKHFFKWLKGTEEVSPPETRWIKRTESKVENRNPIHPKDLLTADEKMALLKVANHPRDRALVEVCMESGRRLGEILTLRIRDVEFDSIGAKLFVNGKIGADVVRIISSSASLLVWLDNHPLRDNNDAPVWVGLGHENRNKQLSYATARNIILDMKERAGIKKRIHFYLFRHTRIDETQGVLTEAQQRSGKHIDDAQAIMNGVKIPKREITVPQGPKNCARCKSQNSFASRFCSRCGYVLDLVTAIQLDEARQRANGLIDEIAKDPEKLKKLRKLLED
jgi:integrase